MSASDDKKQSQISSANGSKEMRLSGRSVSRGVAIGRVVSLHGNKRQFYKINLEDSQINREVVRLYASIRLAKPIKKNISDKK